MCQIRRPNFFATLFPGPGSFGIFALRTRGSKMTDTEQFEVFMRNYQNMVFSTAIRLPAGQRVPLVLYHYEGKSYEEIAEITGSSLSKVKTDIFRAREALRKKLKIDLAGEEGWEEYGGKRATRPAYTEPPRNERFSM